MALTGGCAGASHDVNLMPHCARACRLWSLGSTSVLSQTLQRPQYFHGLLAPMDLEPEPRVPGHFLPGRPAPVGLQNVAPLWGNLNTRCRGAWVADDRAE